MSPRLQPNHELRRLRGDEWLSTGADPQLVVSRRLGGGRYAVIELEAHDRPLDVAVYGRLGGAFNETERVDFVERRCLLLVIDLMEGPARMGCRLDPAEQADSRFSMRAWSCRGRRGLARHVGARLRRRPGMSVGVVGPDPGLRDVAPRLRIPRKWSGSIGATLQEIWEMAALDEGLHPLPHPGPEPVVSFLVPVFNAEPAWLDDLLASFLAQGPGAELVLADDGSRKPETAHWLATHAHVPRLRIIQSAQNHGIAAATNLALGATKGRFVGLLDHDDALAPHAMDRIRRAFAAHPDALFLYTDEVIADHALRPTSAFWKPGFDPVLLSGVNYVNHLSLYNRRRLLALGGLREGFDGSQDYELVLRYVRGLAADEIVHIPYPAYIWRQSAASVSHAQRDVATTRARDAVAEHFGRAAGAARVEPAAIADLHRVRFPAAARPGVSIVIPNRDSFDLMERLLDDLFRRTKYPSFDVVVIDNGSRDPRVRALYDRYAAHGRLRYSIDPAPFNFAEMMNRGARLTDADTLLLLNNDISVLDPDWLTEMVECLAFPGTGIVGARLLFPDRRIQHAGVGLGLGGLAGHWHYKADPGEPGPMGRLQLRNGMTAVTGACMLVTRRCWEALGGMDADAFAVAYNDVDLCARARGLGFQVVWTPFATLIHHESVSRGSDLVGEKAARFRREKAALAMRHETQAVLDPALSPWHSRYHSCPRLVVGERLPEPRHFMGFPGPAAEASRPSGGQEGGRFENGSASSIRTKDHGPIDGPRQMPRSGRG